MKVLINGLQLCDKNSGVQYYTKYLYRAIEEIQNSTIETQLYRRISKLRSPFSNLRLYPSKLIYKWTPLYLLLSFFNSRLQRIIKENFYFPFYIKHNSFDLFHSPNYVLPFFIKSPSVVTVHDLITFNFPKLCQRESVLYFKLFLPRSIKKADKIITASETTKNDIINRFKVPEDKISIIHLGLSTAFKRTINTDILLQYGITKKYILFVGNIEPKKNLVRLLKAYHKVVCTKNITHLLVIAGKKAWKYKEVFRTVHSLKLQNKVIFTGYFPEKDLPSLYSMADLFVFPSLYEGFGIPPLEAMACEIPVLASNTGALPEIIGDNCLMVDPYSVDDIADEIHHLLTNENLRKEYIEKGKNWVKQFTWERAARMTMEVYKEVGKKRQE